MRQLTLRSIWGFEYEMFVRALSTVRLFLASTRIQKGCVLLSQRSISLSSPWSAAVGDKRISGVNECPKDCLCSRNIEAEYKNVRLLSQFVSQQTGMILPRSVTKICLTKQRETAKEIKKAIQMGFMPVTHKLRAYLDDPRLF